MSDKAWFAAYLEGWANSLVARYGHPVYLVGSAIEQPRDTVRDVDVVVVLPDDEFNNRYGLEGSKVGAWTQTQRYGQEATPGARRWAADCGKLAREATKCHPAVNLDVKVQCLSWVLCRELEKRPRLRIDTVEIEPEAIVLAENSNPPDYSSTAAADGVET